MSDLWLRTITPFSTPFALQPGAELRDGEAYQDFWTKLANEEVDLHGTIAASVALEHRQLSAGGRYESAGEDSLDHPVHVVTARFPTIPASDDLPELSGIVVRVFDHNVGIVEFVTDVSDHLQGEGTIEQRVDRLERAASIAGARVLETVVFPWVKSLVAALAARPDHDQVVELADDLTPRALWTSRALFCTRQRFLDENLGRRWLRNAEVAPEVLDEVEQGRLDHVTTWLNYLFVSDDPGADVLIPKGRSTSHAWEGLRYAQYYYSALDQVDGQLALVLAQTQADVSGSGLAALRDRLTWESQRADLIRIERQLTEKFLRRSVRTTMRQILDGWSFDELVAEPVREKAGLCTERVQAIAEAQARRAAIWSDLILLGIAITSILGTALSVAAFGRTLGTESAMAGYDSGTSSVVEWLASQPADSILLVSLVVSAGIAIVYLFYRRSSE